MLLGVVLPLWRTQLFFPQYPEGPLQVIAYAGAITGDIEEIEMLNDYIGVTFPHDLPELKTLPKLLYGVAALSMLGALGRKWLGLCLKGTAIAALIGSGAWAVWRINGHLTRFGANPDPNAPLAELIKPFKPPLWGRAVLVQVEAVASFQWGTFFLAAAGILMVTGFWLAIRQLRGSSTSTT